MLKKLLFLTFLSGLLAQNTYASQINEGRKPEQLVIFAAQALVKKLNDKDMTAVENELKFLPEDLQQFVKNLLLIEKLSGQSAEDIKSTLKKLPAEMRKFFRVPLGLPLVKQQFLLTDRDLPELHAHNKRWKGFSFKELLHLDKSGWPQELEDRVNNPVINEGRTIDLHSLHLNSLAGLKEYLIAKGINCSRVRTLNLADNNFDYVPAYDFLRGITELNLSFNVIRHVMPEQIRAFPLKIWLPYNQLTGQSQFNIREIFCEEFTPSASDYFANRDVGYSAFLEPIAVNRARARRQVNDEAEEINCRQLYLDRHLLEHLRSSKRSVHADLPSIPEGFRPRVAAEFCWKYRKPLPGLEAYYKF